jgi:hypothetical protein
MVDLSQYFKALIAKELRIQPEQVTPEFLEEMRYRMYRDRQNQVEPGGLLRRRTNAEEMLWRLRLRFWAHEILVHNIKMCH